MEISAGISSCEMVDPPPILSGWNHHLLAKKNTTFNEAQFLVFEQIVDFLFSSQVFIIY